jgi:hypothetical protein
MKISFPLLDFLQTEALQQGRECVEKREVKGIPGFCGRWQADRYSPQSARFIILNLPAVWSL